MQETSAFARRIDSWDIRGLIEIDPHPTHGVVHAGKDLHGNFARVIADKLLINFQNAFQLAVENLGIDVSQVEVDHGLAINAEIVFEDDFENRARSDIAWHQVPVFWIPLL